MAPRYPTPPTASATEVLHGVTVVDTYRPLEDADAAATVAWVEAENAETEAFLSRSHHRSAIRERVEELWDYPKLSAPTERGGHYFQLRNRGLQNQAVLYVSEDPADEGRVLIDPNQMSEGGTVSLTSLAVSRDGHRIAYATSEAGSDWKTWHVRDVETGADQPDVLEWCKFSGAAWAPDGSGFYYVAVDQPRPGAELTEEVRTPRVMFHRLGRLQESDDLIYSAPGQPDWFPDAEVTSTGRYLVITVTRGTGTDTLLLVRDLTDPQAQLVPLAGNFEAGDVVVADDGESLYLVTDRGAERRRVMRAAPAPDGRWEGPADWTELVAETDDTLTEAHLYGGRLVCHYLSHACSRLRVHAGDGRWLHDIDLPGPVSLVPGPSGALVEGRPGSDRIFYQVVSFLQSGAVWGHDLGAGISERISASTAPFDAGRFITEQVFVPSSDGTPIPVFLTRPKSAVADGSGRVLLYGYGGFSVPITPGFSVSFAAWLDRGGVLAVANLRGGGEYGRAWHEAGRLANKQNVFDDFAACARWLVDSGWSAPSRIAVSGGSNGGLLVGASITQHPELFGAAVAEVGVFDMLRFHLFTIGWAWKSDYGDPEDPEAFGWLRAYSPLHNVRAGTCYPATMIMTGDHDDRVVPAHSYKFAAALQAAQACDRPVLLRVATSAGHGMGKPTAKLIDEAADRLAFLELTLS